MLDKKKLFHELRHEGFANMSGLQSFLEKPGAGITLTTVIIIVVIIIINIAIIGSINKYNVLE